MRGQVIIARRKFLLAAATLATGSVLESATMSEPAESQTAPVETSGGLLPSWRDGATIFVTQS
jgi:hypothetical protein